jgi:hypothetical protein
MRTKIPVNAKKTRVPSGTSGRKQTHLSSD